MKLLSLKYNDITKDGWDFSEIHLQRVNLFVGASGSGKTRILNIIFNIAHYIPTGKITAPGEWTMILAHENKTYRWYCRAEPLDSEEAAVIAENISVTTGDGDETVLIMRDKDIFKYKNDILPKLSKTSSSISLLKEEPDIAPIFKAISRVARRSFFGDTLEVAAGYAPLPPALLERVAKDKSLETVWKLDVPLNVRLFVLKEKFPTIYQEICARYKGIFPTIEQMDLMDWHNFQTRIQMSGKVPVLGIQEKGVAKPVPLADMSSGMQKVLLILTDILTLPGEVLYMIDEYENSLGINAIDFLPPLLNEVGGDNQFIVTTHHPYLINQLPIKNWHVFHRQGMKVTIRAGASLEAKFGKSKQRAFTQLINDPFYLEGVQ